jgi:hypothetical protein
MTIRGHIENGQIVLDDPIALADGIQVRIEVLRAGWAQADNKSDSSGDQEKSLYDLMQPIVGIVNDLPPDFARNHDHYLHGQPKR